MDYFTYHDAELFAEEVPVRRIAREIGTPVYIYSLGTLRRHFRVFDQAFARIPHLICFSMKANSNLAVLRAFVNEGGGFDIVSRGELFRALRAGADPKKIVFSGVGKKREEIEHALASGILMFNVESEQELVVLNSIASQMDKRAPISLRINPDVDPQTHPYISTGMKKSKFGIDIKRSMDGYRNALALSHLEVVGVDCHIGSQLTSIPPFVDALSRVKIFVQALRNEGVRIRYLDLGGGLGIRYREEEPPHPEQYAEALIEELHGLDVTLILEPGRVIVGNAGILVTEVLYVKETEEKKFVVVDGGMNDLIRPALYGSYQAIRPVTEAGNGKIVADVVGPICESGDFFAKEREIARPKPGDLLAVMSAGAYGFTMASNYNSRTRPAEVLVDGKDFYVVRARERLEDLILGEVIPPILEYAKGSEV
ncbi:MAG: diaminopimelate decarboxylase [Deltaproteobacteria bacterium]|nr:diaminopimelate decarboxylase [Deltaproteobacteria bacterium]